VAREPGVLRWADPGLLILGSLASGPKHGYAIVGDVQRTASVTLGPGTLYGALARLEEHGLVEPLAGEDRRRPYRLTAAGAQALETQLSSMSRFARTGRRRLQARSAQGSA
jgi:DNA-binding PadR family transcriptional regulator